MKKVKSALKKLIVIYLIVYITLSSMTSCFARGYDKQCGEYASQWARDYVEKYAAQSSYTQSNLGFLNGNAICKWSGGRDGDGTFYGCCTCFVHWVYYNALGIDLYEYGFSPSSTTAYNDLKGGNQYFDDVSSEELQAGDILLVKGHAELYAGDGQHANFGGTPMNVHNACSRMTPGKSSENAIAVRLKNSVDVTPAGTLAFGDVEEENLSIYDENGFIYSGVAKIQGYKGSQPFGKWIISMLTEILDYLIGILTLGIRIVVVGWTAIVEGLINNLVNAVTGVTGERVDNWEKDPNTIDEIDREAQGETVETGSQATGQPGDDDYISEGVQGVADIGGNIQLNVSSKANVTVENIVYNKIPILDINFFNFDSAGRAVVEENGIIHIIKTNVAMWYYIFRVIAIILMLLILIYLGIQIALTSATEKKATYKEMLVSWVAGFIIIFAISYIMFAIIYLNETFISWVIPRYENGAEISLYESVRTKAYELKATSGFAGLVMYIILIYYAIRFLLVYFKRYLTVTILALLSPFVGVAYALEKVNKKGRGRGEILSNMMKDFTYSVTLQSVHALIYTIFIQIVLKLTETSLVGIFISFIFLHFMIKMDPIWRKVFGFSAGSNTAKLSVDELAPKVALIKGVGKSTVSKARKYGNFVGKHVGGPVYNNVGKLASRISNSISESVHAEAERLGIEDKEKTEKERKKEEEEKRKTREQLKESAKVAASFGKNALLGGLAAAAAIPIMIVEPKLGIELLASAVSSKERIIKTIEGARKKGLLPKTAQKGKTFKLKGVRAKNGKAFNKLLNRFNGLGIKFKLKQPIGESDPSKNNAPKGKNSPKINTETRRRLLTRINIGNLKFASGGKRLEDILDEDDGEDKATAYSRILEEARNVEQQLEDAYREAIGKIDDELAEAQGIDPEFLKVLQAKKAKELSRAASILSKPLSEKDIYMAVQNYKSNVPTFNNDLERISERDIEGIAKEVNSILEAKGQEIQMSKEFIEKVKKEITDSRRREQESKVINVAGQDMTPRAEDQSIKERKRTLATNDSINPMSSQKQEDSKPPENIDPKDSIERLVKNIQNASKGTDSKTSQVVPRATIKFAKNLEQLQSLSREAAGITGEELYSLEEILKRLEQL